MRSADVEETIDIARECLQSKIVVGDGEILALDFAEVLVQVADACVIGLPCEKHGGTVHGREAEELRAGVEQVLRNTAEVLPEDAEAVLGNLRKSLYFLLDRIDARDSLAFLEASKVENDQEAST